MRITKLALLLLLGALFGSQTAHAQPPDRGDAGTQYFHQRLSPYGEWGTHASYGEVWRPHVAAGWSPYTTGHWVYTDYGWTWAADEPWGWAPFHYGRWYNDASLGWGWVPGNVWAPAWVDWRNGGGYVGWAALPPEAGFTAGVGIIFGGALAASCYRFVPEGSILEPRLGGFFVPPARNADLLRGASGIHGIAMVNGRIFNQGVSVQRIAQASGHAVPTERVGNQAAFYRPAAVTNAARTTGSESFVNRQAPRAASAAAASVPAGSRSTSRPTPNARSAKANVTSRGPSRSAAVPTQGQRGSTAVGRSRTQRASPNHATPPPAQRRRSAAATSRSHAATAPQHRAPKASARPNPAPRHVAGTHQPARGTQPAAARSNPPPRHAAAASQHSAPAQAKAKARQPSPPRGEHPQG